MTVFAVFYRPGPKWTEGVVRENAARRQREYLQDAVRRGLVVQAGDLGDGELLVMLDAPSATAAHRFVTRDPSVAACVHQATVREFEVEYGL
ncbi:MAG: hypothetical protein AB7O98_12425 [Hyphomonadaceae bacterium]